MDKLSELIERYNKSKQSKAPSGVDKELDLEDDELISNGKKIKLNENQYKAVLRGREFLEDKDSYFLCIQGSAGTGKSTVSKAILKGQLGIVVTAPTHKAKKVISRLTGYPGETIHKIVGLAPAMDLEDFSATNVLFSLGAENSMGKYFVILIDESSMLPKDLVSLLIKKALELRVKIIFMGDPRQLPPVKETISDVFVNSSIIQVKLTKVERQILGNPAIGLLNQILDRIDEDDELFADDKIEYSKHEIPFDAYSSDLTPEGLGYSFLQNQKEFGEFATKAFKLNEDLNNRIICWSNDCVALYNAAIRKRLIGDHTLPLQVGEFLMAYQSVKDEIDWKVLRYENSADYLVKSITDGYKLAANYEDTKINKYTNIEGWFVFIEDTDNLRQEKVFIVKPESYQKYIKIEQDYFTFAVQSKNNKKWAWKQYYSFRSQFAVMADIRAHYQGLVSKPKEIKIDFDFAYAITAHKSQGSTYDNVYIILDNILANPDPRERWRLAYVAISRLSKAAYILKS